MLQYTEQEEMLHHMELLQHSEGGTMDMRDMENTILIIIMLVQSRSNMLLPHHHTDQSHKMIIPQNNL